MKIKGNVLLARKAFVETHFGPNAWPRVLEALPADDQVFFSKTVANVGWYPFDVGRRLDEAIFHVLGKGSESVFEEIGVSSARENLTTVHQHFLAPGNPQGFLRRAGAIYGFYYDTGRRTYDPAGPLSGVLTTYDADTFSRVDCLTVIGWYKEALRMCGAKGVTMREETCRATGGEFCRYRVSWTE